MKIRDCRINHLESPMGFSLDKTVFSWIVEEGVQETARIQVWKGNGIVADTGFSRLDALAAPVEIALEPRTLYTWQVQVRGGDGSVAASGLHSFETGKMEEPWEAAWITCRQGEKRLPEFYRKLPLPADKRIVKARLYICGLGLYEAYLDGEKIGKEFLTPGINSYDCWLQAQTFDITGQLSNAVGKNGAELSVILADGWYKGRFDYESDNAGIYGATLQLIAEARVLYEDGSEAVFVTDDSWQVRRSRIVFAGIYDGEQRDDTLEELPVEKAFLCTEDHPVLKDRLGLPILEQESFDAVLLHTPKGETVLDIGQNIAGLFTLRVHEPRGTKIQLQAGEVLQDGCFYRDNLRTAKAEYVYISDGEEHVIQPKFTFYGFRYMKVQGVSSLRPEDFRAFAIYSAIGAKGEMVTGNAKVNQLISNIVWGMKGNFVGLPTDCPQRDERMGWTGDAQVFSETACYLADTYVFYQKYLYDMAREQEKLDGLVPSVVPAFRCRSGASVWGDATCIIPWNLYLYYGDKTILEQHYDSMKAWLDYIGRVDGDHHGWREVFHYGDWLALDSPYHGAAQTRGGTDEGYIADIYYRKSALIAAKTARLLGKEKEAEGYGQLAERIREGIIEEYFSATGRCCIDTQTAALLNLKEGICGTDRAAERLKTLLENNENKLKTGFVGTPLLCEVLTEIGAEKTAFDILLNEEYPGWLYEVNLGATTVWERWNSLDETGHISSTGMNSLNHYAYGAIGAWLWKCVAGLRCMEERPGFRSVEIKPNVNWRLRSIRAKYPSPAGSYEIAWEALDLEYIHMKFAIPAGCSARITLPCFKEEIRTDGGEAAGENPLFAHREGNAFLVGSGVYEVTYRTKEPVYEPLTIDTRLRKIMTCGEARKMLRREFPDINHLLSYTAEYPLSETMRNLKYEETLIEKLDGLLREIV